MKIRLNKVVFNNQSFKDDFTITLVSKYAKEIDLTLENAILYPPLINSHDHLIGNWCPKATCNNPYDTVDKWVDEMRFTPTFLERNKIWKGSGKFNLVDERARLITLLGSYKNLFSGVHIVQDHISYQKHEYYTKFPIQVLEKYKQCHSMSMGNWWGGKTPTEEYQDTKGKIPFVIHLAEGTNKQAHSCFAKFKEAGLVKSNVMLVHGIALSEANIIDCAQAGTNICWCPDSNMFLIGKTLNIQACLKHGVNVVIGTDSTMSGSINLLEEMKFGALLFPEIPANIIFKMVTENAAKALMLPAGKGVLSEATEDLLIMKQKNDDPYRNLLECDIHDIRFMLSGGIPLLGEKKLLDLFNINEEDYSFYNDEGTQKFVFGHPDLLNQQVNDILGYEKKFPFFPF